MSDFLREISGLFVGIFWAIAGLLSSIGWSASNWLNWLSRRGR